MRGEFASSSELDGYFPREWQGGARLAFMSDFILSDMKNTAPKLIPVRCKAALLIRRKTLIDIARTGGVGWRHLAFVIAGQRVGSERLYRALRDALGTSGWAFVTGESDSLYDDGAHHAAA